MNRHRNGFTLVELVIVITILTILFALAVISVRSSLPKARDSERAADVNAIAEQIESYARNKTSDVVAGGQGSYIPTRPLQPPAPLSAEQFATSYLPNIERAAFYAPDVDTSQPMSLVVATNDDTDYDDVLPQPTTDTYVYQPLQHDGSLCADSADSCTSFYIHYKLEKPNDACSGSPKVFCSVKGSRL